MKTLTLSLTDAFKVRQMLKKSIANNSAILRTASIYYDPETENRTHINFTSRYGSIEALMNLVLEEQNTLGELNTAFDKANIEVRPLLNKAESLNCGINTLEQFDYKLETATDVRVETINNEKTITKLTAECSDDLVKKVAEKIKDYKREKFELESKISELNGLTKLTISIDDQVYNDIYNA